MRRTLEQQVFAIPVARWAIALVFLCRGYARLAMGRLYAGLEDLCWVVRVSQVPLLAGLARRRVFATIEESKRTGRNEILESYRADAESAACANLFAFSGTGPHDLFRDVIVLKKATASEKGVILLKYGRTFKAMAAIFDLERLRERYTFVLEPCWAGYCDTSILMLLAPGNPLLVQCFTEEDYQFISDVGEPLVPLRGGPADWVDADLFAPPAVESKPYDFVMVANWGAHKRHSLLFRALSAIEDRRIRVLLIGFPWSGRNADDIRKEAAAVDNDRVQIDVLERIPAVEVARHVSQCKVFVFLSKKEGDNKALVEAMFVGLPAIVYEKSIGGAASRINAATGIFSSDEELSAKLTYMLDHYREFSPRAWALENTGSAAATRKLNEALKRAVTSFGGRYSEPIAQKTNSPNLAYKDPASRARFEGDYQLIKSCRHGSPRSAHEAVA